MKVMKKIMGLAMMCSMCAATIKAKTAITPVSFPPAVGPFSQAVTVAPTKMTFVSGQLPINKDGSIEIDDIKAAAIIVMDRIGVILKEGGMDYSNIVKTTIYLTDMKNFAAVNNVYASYLKDLTILPARETVGVVALPMGATVEISVVAVQE